MYYVSVLVMCLLSPPSSKDTGTRGSGQTPVMIESSMEPSVGDRGQKKGPLVLSAPEISKLEADSMDEAVKDFKRVSVS